MLRFPFRLRSVRTFSCVPIVLAAVVAPRAASADQTAASSRPQTGMVVDAQGGAVLRAHVRVVDPRGAVIASGLTDERGRFEIESPVPPCRIDVSLSGFRPASEPCGTAEVRVVLGVAPVQESVVVSATRDAAPTSQVGSAVSVLAAEDIDRRGAALLSDVLRATPGVTVVRSGGLGTQTSLFVRGGESSYNKVLLDGIPLNEPGGTFNFSNLTTGHLDRVEIVRGAESALFGSDAMSSVIQLFTRRAGPGGGRPRATLSAEAGSHDTFRGSAGLAGRASSWDYALDAARLQSDNHVANNAFENATASWNSGGRLAGGVTLRVLGRIESQRTGTPGATAFGRADLDAFFDRRDVTTGVTLQQQAGAFKQGVSYAYVRSRQTSANLLEDPPFTPAFDGRVGRFESFDFLFDNQNVLERHRVAYQADWRAGRTAAPAGEHFFTVAVEWDGERARLDNRLGDVVVPASRDNAGATVQHQLVAGRTAVTSGVRVERNDSFGTAVVPRVSAVHVLRRGREALGETMLRVTAGAGIKEPTILQSFSPSPFFLGNPDLEPERSRAVSAGVEQRLAGDHAKIDLVWFDHRYRNQISTRTLGFSPFRAQYFNIGRTEAKGLELSATVAPAAAIRARGGYTLLASRIVESTSPTNPLFQPGQPAFRRPRHSGFVDIGWTAGPFDMNVTGVFVGERVDSDFVQLVPPITSAPAHALWTAAARWRAGSRLDLSLRIENAADARYMEPLGFPAWGRTVHAGVRVKF